MPAEPYIYSDDERELIERLKAGEKATAGTMTAHFAHGTYRVGVIRIAGTEVWCCQHGPNAPVLEPLVHWDGDDARLCSRAMLGDLRRQAMA